MTNIAISNNMSSQNTSFAVFNGKNSSDPVPKISTSSSDSKKPLYPCGWKLYFAECFYIIKNARPIIFKPSTESQRKVVIFLMYLCNKRKVDIALEKAENFKKKQATKSFSKTSNLPGDTVRATAAVNTAIFSQPSEMMSEYPLKNSFILESGSDGHICNDFSRFSNYYSKKSVAVAGSGVSKILGYGTVFMRISSGLFQLNDVAYIPSFHNSLASLIRLQAADISGNPQRGCILSEKIICFAEKKFNQYVIEFHGLVSLPLRLCFFITQYPNSRSSSLAQPLK